MKKTICQLALATAMTLSAKGAKTTCTDAGANFTITPQSSGNPGLSPDGGGEYVNGENGVIGRINCDGDSLELSGTRYSYLLLGTPQNGGAPSWADNSAPVAFFNIPLGAWFNNAAPYNGSYTIQTYLKVTMASPHSGYFFDLENPTAGASIGLQAPTTGVNTPTVTTAVNVAHTAQVVDAFGNVTTPETWVVTPVITPAVGTLLSNIKGGLRAVGQFLTAFSITVTRQ